MKWGRDPVSDGRDAENRQARMPTIQGPRVGSEGDRNTMTLPAALLFLEMQIK